MPKFLSRTVVMSLAAVMALSWPAMALAQNPAPAGKGRWSVELYGGGIIESQSTSGTPIGEFPAGDTFVTDSLRVSRHHPSWRFGDGALLFNQVAAAFGQINGRTFATITPIDDVLRSSGDRSGGRAAFGLRVGRDLTPTVALEILIERSSGGLTASDTARAAIATADASFEAAFRDLLGTAPILGLQVDSDVTLPETSRSQTRILGAVSKVLTARERWSLTATAGAGVQLRGGDPAEVRMNGRYQFSLFGTSPIFERDEVFISFDEKETSVVGLLGLSAIYDLTQATGVRIGVRAHLTGNGATTSIRTAPTVSTGQTPGTLPSLTTPGIQFSNTTSALSSLRPSLASTLTTFTGSGTNRQVVITLGLVRRF